MAWIRIVEGRNQGATYNVGRRTCTVGRSPGNYVQLLDPDVSRRHLQLAWDGDSHRVVDLSSANGIFVNGERVLDTWLKDGDLLALGRTVLCYVAADALPGAQDFTQQYKTPAREVAGIETKAVDVTEVLSQVANLQAGGGAWAGAANSAATSPVASSPTSPAASAAHSAATSAATSGAHPRPPSSAATVLDHLSARRAAGDDPDALMPQATAALARLLQASRACVMLRRLDPATGVPRLVPLALWVQPDLPAGARDALVHEGVVREVAGGRPTHAALGVVPGGPTVALAASVASEGLWYGLIYADSLASPPPSWRQGHLDLMARVGALLGDALRAST